MNYDSSRILGIQTFWSGGNLLSDGLMNYVFSPSGWSVTKAAWLVAFGFAVITFQSLSAQEIKPVPVDWSDLAEVLKIEFHKSEVNFQEPVYARITLTENGRPTSFQTSTPLTTFQIMFRVVPSELAVEKPQFIKFMGNIVGQSGTQGSFASVNLTETLDPHLSGFGFGGEIVPKPKPTLDKELPLFEEKLFGKIGQNPRAVDIRGSVTFSKHAFAESK